LNFPDSSDNTFESKIKWRLSMGRAKRFFIITALLIIALFIGGYQAFQTVKGGATAYVFGYPLVLMDVTRQVMTAPETKRGPVNHFTHIQFFPDHTFREVVRPNNDTLYSTAWIDLSAGPLVLSVPDTAGRYYVMPFMDAWTNVFAMVGKRETGTSAGNFLVAGPDWKGNAPKNLKIIQSPTNMTWLIGRIQTNGKEDFENVFKLQEQFLLTTLGNWESRRANPPCNIKEDMSQVSKNPSDRVANMSPETFFANLSRLMGEQPPSKADAPIMEMLENFDIAPGKPFDTGSLNFIKRGLLKKAVEIARKKLDDTVRLDRSSENNWTVIREGIGSYGIDYGVRAFVSLVGLGALPPDETVYPNAHKDSDGNLLSGQNRYRIHFEKGSTPPVDAFWSLTLYDDKGFLTDNLIQRYALGDKDNLKFNTDGSLDILIQTGAPDKNESNWLPAPGGTFAVTLRLYMPKDEFLNKDWTLPPIHRIPKE
jgi:hypothetical protein